MCLCRDRCIPEHALHKKRLQTQNGVGPLASSLERREAVVPLTNRLSTLRQLHVNRLSCSSFRFAWDLKRACFRRNIQDACLRRPGCQRREFVPCPNRSAPPPFRPAPLRRPAPPRPATSMGCPGFGFDGLRFNMGVPLRRRPRCLPLVV